VVDRSIVTEADPKGCVEALSPSFARGHLPVGHKSDLAFALREVVRPRKAAKAIWCADNVLHQR